MTGITWWDAPMLLLVALAVFVWAVWAWVGVALAVAWGRRLRSKDNAREG